MELTKILVIGSTNMDMVAIVPHIPIPGETVLASSFFMNPGGKGANQAVAAARLGGNVFFLTKLGNDVFGKQAIQLFKEERIDTTFIHSDNELPSGVALVTVDEEGENSIVVAPGANANLLPDDLENDHILNMINEGTVILMQLEIPLQTVSFIIDYAAKTNATVILNPAPMAQLSDMLLKKVDIITPNKTEAEMLSGISVTDIESAKKAAKVIYDKGVKNVVITLGSQGAVVLNSQKYIVVPALKVKAIDTTAAGDVFNGALAVGIAEKKDLVNAVEFACTASAISVTRMGAQSSIPYRSEILSFNIKSYT